MSVENLGKLFGYPQCCIDQFTEEFYTHQFPALNRIAKYPLISLFLKEGFVPCNNHVEKILLGEIKLEDLITDRDPRLFPFPDDSKYEDLI